MDEARVLPYMNCNLKPQSNSPGCGARARSKLITSWFSNGSFTRSSKNRPKFWLSAGLAGLKVIPLSIQPEILKRGSGVGWRYDRNFAGDNPCRDTERNAKRLNDCFHEPRVDVGRGLSMNQVQNGKSDCRVCRRKMRRNFRSKLRRNSGVDATVFLWCKRNENEHVRFRVSPWNFRLIARSHSPRKKFLTKVSWLRGTGIEREVQLRTLTPGSPSTPRSRPSVFC